MSPTRATCASQFDLDAQPFHRRSLRAIYELAEEVRHWIDDSALSDDDRARAHFAFSLLNDAVSPSTPCSTRWPSRSCSSSGGNSVVRGT